MSVHQTKALSVRSNAGTYTTFIDELTVFDSRAPKMKNLPKTTALNIAPTTPVCGFIPNFSINVGTQYDN